MTAQQPREVDRFANRLVLASPVLFDRAELDQYEKEILANSKATEHDASRFFERFPKFLFMGRADRLRREVWLYDNTGKPVFRTDFFRNRFGSPNWDIVELKTPKSDFVNSRPDHLGLSAKVHEAIDQAQYYRDLLLENQESKIRLLASGIRVCRPKMIVVVGRRSSDIPIDRIEVLRDREAPIEALSYTDIFEFAKDMYRATGLTVFPINTTTPPVPADFTGARLSLLDFPAPMDDFGAITMSDVQLASRGWEHSQATGVPNVRRVRVPKGTLYFYLGTESDLKSVFGTHLQLAGRTNSSDQILLPLGLNRYNRSDSRSEDLPAR